MTRRAGALVAVLALGCVPSARLRDADDALDAVRAELDDARARAAHAQEALTLAQAAPSPPPSVEAPVASWPLEALIDGEGPSPEGQEALAAAVAAGTVPQILGVVLVTASAGEGAGRLAVLVTALQAAGAEVRWARVGPERAAGVEGVEEYPSRVDVYEVDALPAR